MRTFKFRAWEDGDMYYNVRCGGMFDGVPTAPTAWMEGIGDWTNLTGQPHTVIMQYTGIKDKKGKDIYEGDLLKTDLDRPFVAVVYRNGAFMYQCFDNGEEYYDYMFPVSAENKETEECMEVVGNVFEMPDWEF